MEEADGGQNVCEMVEVVAIVLVVMVLVVGKDGLKNKRKDRK